jgi:outer membrane protein OmpA-like peptidoglycan-associated protein
MNSVWRLGAATTLALFLVCASFADTTKKDSKTNDSSGSLANAATANPAPDAANNGAASNTGDGASSSSQTSAAAAPAAAPAAAGDSAPVPKWIPMPAMDGNPGLFTLETGDILPKGAFDATVGVDKYSRMPGNITDLDVGPSFGYGFTKWFSGFIQINAYEHIHVDQPGQLSLNLPLNPQYGNTIYNSFLPTTVPPFNRPAYVEDFPFASHNGGGVGEIDLGFKIGLLSERRGNRLSLSVRNDFFLPTRTTYTELLQNEVQYGRFNYGIGIEASKRVLHRSILATINWSYRFTRDSSYRINTVSGPEVLTLSVADPMQVGVGLLMFPDKRINVITEYDATIFAAKGIPNTTFGARDPVDSITGVRIYAFRRVAVDVGYRYSLSLLNHQDRNGFIAKVGAAYWPEKPREPDVLTSSCSVDKSSVMEGSGEYAQASVNASDSYGYPLTYTWTASGGKITSTGPSVRWDPTGAAAGTVTLTTRVDNGAGKTSSCSSTITVQPKPSPPPTMSCSADRATVLVGERPQITANVNDQTGTALTYTWQANGGQVVGTGSSVQFDTSGLSPGTYTVTGRVENGRGGAADCSAGVAVEAPPPPPQASKIGDCSFRPSSARVDNVCKRVLDDVALRLQNDPKGKVILVGFADPKEPGASKLAARRADGTRKYLSEKQGMDASRIDVRSANGSAATPGENRRLDVVWVPDGASY